MPTALPIEVKLQILKHYIDLCVEDAADTSEYERPRSMYYTVGVPEQYHARGQVCLNATEKLLSVEPTLRVTRQSCLASIALTSSHQQRLQYDTVSRHSPLHQHSARANDNGRNSSADLSR